MKLCVLTLGCKVNSYESEFIKEKFINAGYSIVSLKENPDVVVVNTCSVTNQSDAKSRHIIRMARREASGAILVVCGCSSQNHQEDLKEMDIDILLGNKDKSRILEIVEEYQKTREQVSKFYDMSKVDFEDMCLRSEQDHTRAFVKIQDGCENFCSYCIIPYLRGRQRSKDLETAYKEVKSLVENGHKEIVLTGIHTGSYGNGTDYDLVDLIRKISSIEGLLRIRISSIEITELTDKFLEELKVNSKLCDHMHIPLQSGSDEVLKKMNRKYDTAYYKDVIERLRSIRPNISITTDLIVGFPYETDAEFEKTFEFLKEINFTKIHTFPFSLRSGTKAEEMKEHFVDDTVKKARVQRVLELSSELEENYYKKFVGESLDVIIEVSSESGSKGHTSNYILVNTKESYEEGSVVSLEIDSVDGLVVNGHAKKLNN